MHQGHTCTTGREDARMAANARIARVRSSRMRHPTLARRAKTPAPSEGTASRRAPERWLAPPEPRQRRLDLQPCLMPQRVEKRSAPLNSREASKMLPMLVRILHGPVSMVTDGEAPQAMLALSCERKRTTGW